MFSMISEPLLEEVFGTGSTADIVIARRSSQSRILFFRIRKGLFFCIESPAAA